MAARPGDSTEYVARDRVTKLASAIISHKRLARGQGVRSLIVRECKGVSKFVDDCRRKEEVGSHGRRIKVIYEALWYVACGHATRYEHVLEEIRVIFD